MRIDERVSGAHRFESVRAHLLEMAADMAEARGAYRRAARQPPASPSVDICSRERHGWTHPRTRRDAQVRRIVLRPSLGDHRSTTSCPVSAEMTVTASMSIVKRSQSSGGSKPRSDVNQERNGVLAGVGGQHRCSADLGISSADFGGAVAQAPRIPRDAVYLHGVDRGAGPGPFGPLASTRCGAGRRGSTDRHRSAVVHHHAGSCPVPRWLSTTGRRGPGRRARVRRSQHQQSWPSAQSAAHR